MIKINFHINIKNLMRNKQSFITYILWSLLTLSTLWGIISEAWDIVFSSILTLSLSFIPLIFEKKTKIQLPASFISAVVFFAFATLFLGEVGGFYERFWWWDIVLHAGSAVIFGMIGTILVLLLLRGDKLEASAFLVSMLAFSFAVSIGAIWEIFEFFMDRTFGLNMQKSGLDDTMYDLIVDCLGAFIGALTGYIYLKGKERGLLSQVIAEFIESNRNIFRKNKH